MSRRKVKLAFIENDSTRKTTFKKRTKGLVKKISELVTLCGISACMIMYSPFNDEPEVWPFQAAAQSVINDFKAMSKKDQGKKMLNQETFLNQAIQKTNHQFIKLCRDNRDKEITQLMFESLAGKPLINLSPLDLKDLNWKIQYFLNDIDGKINSHMTRDENVPKTPIETLGIHKNDGDNLQNPLWLMSLGIGKMIPPTEDNIKDNNRNNNNNWTI